MWVHHYTSTFASGDTPETESIERNTRKFATGSNTYIHTNDLMIFESTSITWPSIAH